MKSLSKLFMACGLIVGLAACNKELTPQQELPNSGKETIDLAFNISMQQTKSQTENPQEGQTPSNADPDNEAGSAVENSVNSVQLVLLDPSTHEIVAISNPTKITALAGKVNDKYICPFESEQLLTASANGARTLDVIAYINRNYVAPEQIAAAIAAKTFDKDQVYDLASADPKIWDASTGFVMSNAKPVAFELPAQSVLLQQYKDKPLNIGTVYVERLAARFDIYTKTLKHQIEGQPYQVEFTHVGLSNVSRRTYILRRVNGTGINSASYEGFLGAELNNNYICDYDAERKNTVAVENKAIPEQDVKELFTTVAPAAWDDLNKLTSKHKDPQQWKGDPANDYKVWEYTTENVLPAPAAGSGLTTPNNQFENLTTNIAFQGKLTALPDAPEVVRNAFKAGDYIYVFDNTLYGNQKTLALAAKGGLKEDGSGDKYEHNSALDAAYEAALKAAGENPTADAFAAEAKKNDRFIVFKADAASQSAPIYYLYGNKHNNNGLPKDSGVMEYAVVRNNVYKLKINKVYSFGTPEFVPGQPIPWEKGDAKFEVNVTVLPWTVRVNDIDF